MVRGGGVYCKSTGSRKMDKEREEQRKDEKQKKTSVFMATWGVITPLLCYRKPTLQHPPVSFCQRGTPQSEEKDRRYCP